jgi:hypothetical protein
METKKLIHKHRKQIAILKMIDNAQQKFESHIELVNLGLHLNYNLQRAKVMLQIEERLLTYYYSL